MALTEEEKRLLAQLEASLAADDPQLAHRLRGVGQRQLPVRRLVLALVGMAAGVTLLVLGMQVHPLLSVLGFLIMLASCVGALGVWRTDDAPRAGRSTRARSGRAARAPRRPATGQPDGEFMNRVEERWRRRQEGGRN